MNGVRKAVCLGVIAFLILGVAGWPMSKSDTFDSEGVELFKTETDVEEYSTEIVDDELTVEEVDQFKFDDEIEMDIYEEVYVEETDIEERFIDDNTVMEALV